MQERKGITGLPVVASCEDPYAGGQQAGERASGVEGGEGLAGLTEHHERQTDINSMTDRH